MNEVRSDTVSTAELVKLCAVDTELFGRTFFPKAFRQTAPSFAGDVWSALENPNYRYVNLKMSRGFAKTTRLRVFASKRIAYGISRTILYIGASEAHAIRSVEWLRSRIEAKMGKHGELRTTEFGATFNLRPGKKWQAHEIEIFHGVEEHPIWIMGVGITGNVRGINFDDYRPDLIIVDDPVTDENAVTMEQCNKISDLIMGAVANSLASTMEEPNAKMVMLQTPISPHDASARAEASDEWHTEVFGCWTEETEHAPLDEQVSAWPEMFPTRELQAKKLHAIREGRYSVFAREMECKLVAAETLSFRANWLRKEDVVPPIRRCVIAIDPVPPPSDIQLAKGLRGKDSEAIGVIGVNSDGFHVIDYAVSKGHEPNWTVAKAFEFHMRYKPLCWVVETIAYQRVLKWLLEKEMQRRGIYAPVKDTKGDRRRKFDRIVSTLSGPASQGRLFCRPHMTDFILQFEGYGIGYKGHDDVIDMVSIGVSELTKPYLELTTDEIKAWDDDIPEFPLLQQCP